MKRTVFASVESLIEKVGRGELRLPEIQRAYEWKSSQISGLIDSLYRGYPSGSLLLWETETPVEEREMAIAGPSSPPLTRPQYILDGQQRLTSLHRVFSGHDKTKVVFNVEDERFQIESAATRKDVRWISVHDLLAEKERMFSLVTRLHNRLQHLVPDEIESRLSRVKMVAKYMYFVEVLEDLPYEEVTNVFVRVNSKGKPLTNIDLGLATVSARWPGVIARLQAEQERWRAETYDFPIGFLARCLAALASPTGGLKAFTTVSLRDLEEGWQRTQRRLEHLVPLLRHNVRIPNELLPSISALTPLVAFLGLREDKPLATAQINALIYWLFGAFLFARYSGSTETVTAQDLAAVRSNDPLGSLFRNLGLFGGRLVVTEEALAGRGVSSPYFVLSYLVAQRAGARDWWYGTVIDHSSRGSQALEYHHVHPKATLKDRYSKAEINDLANLVFISSRANRKISNRPPAKYFPELLKMGDDNLRAHFMPLDSALRTPDAYPDFVRDRRRLLAAAMTELLDRYRPPSLMGEEVPLHDPAAGEQLEIAIYADAPEAEIGVVVCTARVHGQKWQVSLALSEFRRFLEDLQNGLTAELTVGGEVSTVETGAETVEVAMGPLLVIGTLQEWRKVFERELGELLPADAAPLVQAHTAWKDERLRFPVIDSE